MVMPVLYADEAPLLPSSILRICHVNFDYVTLSSLNWHAMVALANVGTLKPYVCVCRCTALCAPRTRLPSGGVLGRLEASLRLNLYSWDPTLLALF
ncbi:hypothetical protein K438DRAFT_1818771, partial [Mycena galopus ATCC 62051]